MLENIYDCPGNSYYYICSYFQHDFPGHRKKHANSKTLRYKNLQLKTERAIPQARNLDYAAACYPCLLSLTSRVITKLEEMENKTEKDITHARAPRKFPVKV